MEKSIETIWKEGFLNNEAMIAPQVNELYNQKSIHLVEKFKRMFKINLNAIIVGALLFLGASYLVGIPIMGIGFLMTLSIIVVVNKRLSISLNNVDKSQSSYHYIQGFHAWINQMLRINQRLARVYYPLFFLFGVLGFRYANFEGKLWDSVMQKLAVKFPAIYAFMDMPMVGIGIVAVIMALLALFAGKIYAWDYWIVYGRVHNKLDELVADMEELRS